MRLRNPGLRPARAWLGRALAALACAALLAPAAAAFQLTVTGPNGAPVTAYRWLVEEDATYNIVPGKNDPASTNACYGGNVADCLATNFHASYMPVVAGGHSGDPLPTLDASKRYFVSVLPDADYGIGGAALVGDGLAEVKVQSSTVPAAQIRIFVFGDNFPLNGAPDTPEEVGLPGFKVFLEDAGGRYGASAGQASQNAFGVPTGSDFLGGTDPYDITNWSLQKGAVFTDADGYAVIQDLAPGKYGIQIIPPAEGTCPAGWVGSGKWQQTSTIEGTKLIDAWVKADEPPFFTEFGPPGPHVFIGFTQDCRDPAATGLGGGTDLNGQVHAIHNSRPPEFTFWDGYAYPSCWVALNDLAVGLGQTVYAGPCDANSNFSIPGVADGNYNLTLFDSNLTMVIASQNITVGPATTPPAVPPTCVSGTPCSLGNVSAFPWFAHMDAGVFNDINENGFWDEAAGEGPLLEQAVNIRWRDGSLYQSMPTDLEGMAPFETVFPFFNWLVAEVDFTRFKATGATVVVDGGGEVLPDAGWTYPSWGKLTPQPQFCTLADIAASVTADAGADGLLGTPDDVPCTTVGTPINNPNTPDNNNLSRTETGPVLTKGFQAFLGQTNVLHFGKKEYAPGENGGVTGVVWYAVTRAEDDPRYAAVEPWEPGIPRIQVALYQDAPPTHDERIDDLDGDGCQTVADVDNYPFQWAPMYAGTPGWTGAAGPEDFDYPALDSANACQPIPGSENGVFDTGDAVQITTTDSWDDSVPTGCQGDIFYVDPDIDPNTGLPIPGTGIPTDCFDGMRNFNQVRPGVFDGGYAFDSYVPGGLFTGAAEQPLPFGAYIVGTGQHPVYQTAKEQDRNVDFGDDYTPSLALLPPVCVGDDHVVPATLALFPAAAEPSGFANQTRRLCDRKQVELADKANAAADFFLFTEVPIAGHIVGGILNDLANEFDPAAPQFGEKFSPPNLPVSVRDWTGQEISRVYSDRWGRFDALVPSTYTANLPMPSGMSPNMLVTCMNDPGPLPNGQIDPNFNRRYSQFCYTFQYMPGTTTYLDTPVVPVAAFAGPNQNDLDCEYPDGTPVIHSASSVSNGKGGGPYVTTAAPSLTITSVGTDPNTGRDFGFGPTTSPGQVSIGGVDVTANITSWAPDIIALDGLTGIPSGQLQIVRGDNGVATETGVTITFEADLPASKVSAVSSPGTIQTAIDLAVPGDLILVNSGDYFENVIMWKPVLLQGWGAASVTIHAANVTGNQLQDWRDKIAGLLNVTPTRFDLLPGQENAAGGPEPGAFLTEEGSGILVLGKRRSQNARNYAGFGIVNGQRNGRIDGISVVGADNGGAIVVNGYADWLEISNNRLFSNTGVYGGGIRVGHPFLTDPNNLTYTDAFNDRVYVHNNQVIENGGLGGVGGGISINTGADNYAVVQNWVCGNFTQGDGGGIGHYGLSRNGIIEGNTVIFNQSFNQGLARSGGGLFIGGAAPLVGAASPLSPGAGSVTVNANLIQGNNAGSGDGAGVRIERLNGQDVVTVLNDANANNDNNGGIWTARLYNNVIVNNVAGFAGGGVSLQDATRTLLYNNTIANNESTATAGLAFAPGSPNVSTAQPAGVVSYAHSAALAAANASTHFLWGAPFANPNLLNNIIRHNRSFHFEIDPVDPLLFGLVPDVALAPYDDLEVLGVAGCLRPLDSILSGDIAAQDPGCSYDFAGGNANIATDADLFAQEYVNGDTGQTINQVELTTIQAQPAFDEGGNFIQVAYAPLSLVDPITGLRSDYHLSSNTVAAVDVGRTLGAVPADIDGQFRPTGTGYDMGADEYDAQTVALALVEFGRGGVPDVNPRTEAQLLAQNAGTAGTPPTDPPLTGAGTGGPTEGGLPGQGGITPDGAAPGVVACSDNYGVGGTPPWLPTYRDPAELANAKCMHLASGDGFINMADNRTLYTFGFRDVGALVQPDEVFDDAFLGAEFPAPSIVVDEGDEFYLSLTNVGMQLRPDLFDPHTVHWHGFPNASSIFDGLPDSGVAINMFGTLTYYYNVVEPGTYMYHCHAEATEHMQMGMLGNLYVHPAQDGTLLGGYTQFAYNDGDGSTGYDIEVPIQITSMDSAFHDASEDVQPLPFANMKDDYPMLNGRGYPDTVNTGLLGKSAKNYQKYSQRVNSLVEATAGQRILLRISNLSITQFYTLASLGIPMQVVGKDAKLLRAPDGTDLYYTTNSVTLGGGEAVDVILDTAGVAPGTYVLYTTNLNYLSNGTEDFGGMMTEIVIN